jgi:hypothetical protein
MADGKTSPLLAKMHPLTGAPLPVQAGLQQAYIWETQLMYRDQPPSSVHFSASEALTLQMLRDAMVIFSPLLVMIKPGLVMLQTGVRSIRHASNQE